MLSPLTRAAIFLVVTINPGAASARRGRALCAPTSPALLRAVGFREPDGQPVLHHGVRLGRLGPAVRAAATRPELHPFREIRAGPRHAVATPGDLLFHIRAERMDLCFELATQIMARLGDAVSPVDEVHGFRYFDDRDLLGFVDGTENPAGAAAIDATLIGDEDPAFAGGSYVIVQKYLHDLAGWNALPTEAQERIIGRTKLSDIELDDAVKPTYAHNALTTIEEDGAGDQDPARQHAVRRAPGTASSAPTSSATPARRARSSRCWRTCSSAARPATTTGCSISAAPSPATCSSCRRRRSWTT